MIARPMLAVRAVLLVAVTASGCAELEDGDGALDEGADPTSERRIHTNQLPPPRPLTANAGLPGEVGRISYWWGKVNVHKNVAGAWVWDPDCSSGANIDPLTYCQKFWPSTVSVTSVSVSSKPGAVWKTGGCGTTYGGDGLQEWTCNEPVSDWNNDPAAWTTTWAHYSMFAADVEQPICTYHNDGNDCGPPGTASAAAQNAIEILVLRCKDVVGCSGGRHVGCKLFGQFCISRRGCGGCPMLPTFYDYQATQTNSGTLKLSRDTILLAQGMTLTVGTTGMTGASFNGDTYLRLFNSAGQQVASNDDYGGTLGSQLSYTAPVADTYTIGMGCYSNGSCSGVPARTVTGTPTGELGRISYWSGKVNLHRTPGQAWTWDSDCSSGANIAPLTYCRKFFPLANSAVSVGLTGKPDGVWKDGGCFGGYTLSGLEEYACMP
jgi:hypothetical protein